MIWNVVSSFDPAIAANFGAAPLPPRAERYRRADEFIEVVKKLWLSWDTPQGEAPEGRLWDETTARKINHHGEFFHVAGPLNVPIGPPGHPIISQAGGSDAGLDLAAKHADVVYAALLHKQAAFHYKAQLRERALAHSRDPDSIRLIPGLVVVLGETREEAYRKHEALHSEDGEEGLVRDFFKRAAFPDISSLDPDKPIDPALFSDTQDESRPVGFVRSFAELAEAEELTPRQLVRRVDGGHRLAVGTPRGVADTILDWWSSGAVDGFNIHIPVLPDGIAEFNRTVIPLLRPQGHFQPSTTARRFATVSGCPSRCGRTSRVSIPRQHLSLTDLCSLRRRTQSTVRYAGSAIASPAAMSEWQGLRGISAVDKIEINICLRGSPSPSPYATALPHSVSPMAPSLTNWPKGGP